MMHGVAESRQVHNLVVCDDDDIAAPAAIAPVRAALGHTCLATEREAALAPAPALDVNAYPVGERHSGSAYAEAATYG
jgi:hypothetical protein